jgi:hypothetical protein
MKLSRLLLAESAVLWLTACATMGPPRPPSLQLPQPPTDLQALRKGNSVTLIWTVPTVTTDRKAVHSVGPTRICRSASPKLVDCGTPVGEALASKSQVSVSSISAPSKKETTSYTDTLPGNVQSGDPASALTYAVEVLNAAGRGAGPSNRVRVSALRPPAAPADFHAELTSQGVVLTWTGEVSPPPSTRLVYRVYRRPEASSQPTSLQQTMVGEVPADQGSSQFSFTDSTFEWEKTYEYHADAVLITVGDDKVAADKTELRIASDDTAEMRVFANDVFPPSVPEGLQAAFSGPGQQLFIDLVWAPNTEPDLAGYNVYRHEEGAPPAKINSELVKVSAYRDPNVISGRVYYYAVSAVDARGNESARSEEAGERVP